LKKYRFLAFQEKILFKQTKILSPAVLHWAIFIKHKWVTNYLNQWIKKSSPNSKVVKFIQRGPLNLRPQAPNKNYQTAASNWSLNNNSIWSEAGRAYINEKPIWVQLLTNMARRPQKRCLWLLTGAALIHTYLAFAESAAYYYYKVTNFIDAFKHHAFI